MLVAGELLYLFAAVGWNGAEEGAPVVISCLRLALQRAGGQPSSCCPHATCTHSPFPCAVRRAAEPEAARAVLIDPGQPVFVKDGTAFFPGSSLTGNGLLTRWVVWQAGWGLDCLCADGGSAVGRHSCWRISLQAAVAVAVAPPANCACAPCSPADCSLVYLLYGPCLILLVQ